jgi:hypothetical protein
MVRLLKLLLDVLNAAGLYSALMVTFGLNLARYRLCKPFR